MESRVAEHIILITLILSFILKEGMQITSKGRKGGWGGMSRTLLRCSHECLSKSLFLLDITVEPIISPGHGAWKGYKPNMILLSNPICSGRFLQGCTLTFNFGSESPSETVLRSG